MKLHENKTLFKDEVKFTSEQKHIKDILKLQKEVEAKIQTLGSRSNNAQLIVNYLFQRPILDANKVKKLTNLSSPSVYKLIDDIESLGIIKETTGAKRGKIYMFREYTKHRFLHN